jgi:hypothetical protein
MKQIEATEFALAMRSVKRAKNIFLWGVLLCLLVQGSGFVLGTFTQLGPRPIVAPDHGGPATTTRPAESSPPANGAETTTWNDLLRWVLPAAKFVAMVSAFLLLAPLWFAALVALQRQGAGVGSFLGSLFWALVLLAMVFPWQQLLRTSLACGAMYNFGELRAGIERIRSADVGLWDHLLFYLRFAAYPLVTFVVWLIVQLKFSAGYARGMSTDEVRTPPVSGDRPAA